MGELARWPGAPEMAKTPLELMTPRPGEGYTPVDKLMWPVVGGLGGLATGLIRNAVFRRPVYASAPYIILGSGILAFCSAKMRDYVHAGQAEDDAITRHYISLHPEDFPPYERKRYADVYMPFNPNR